MSDNKFGPMQFIGKRPSGWHLKIVLKDVTIKEESFSSENFGGKIQALKAAQSCRNAILNARGMILRVRAKRSNASKELLTGVCETKAKRLRKCGAISICSSIAASHPTGAIRPKRFYYSENPTSKDQKSRAEALALANKQRIEWDIENELQQATCAIPVS